MNPDRRSITDITPTDHISGDPKAPVKFLEYGDYECHHCGAAHTVTKELQKTLGENLCFVFRNFPLRSMHPHAENAAETAEAAATIDRFWPMHDLLFENQENLEVEYLLEYGAQVGLDANELSRDLSTRRHYPRVQQDLLSGMRAGVNGTPTFFINGMRHNAGYDFETLLNAILDVGQIQMR